MCLSVRIASSFQSFAVASLLMPTRSDRYTLKASSIFDVPLLHRAASRNSDQLWPRPREDSFRWNVVSSLSCDLPQKAQTGIGGRGLPATVITGCSSTCYKSIAAARELAILLSTVRTIFIAADLGGRARNRKSRRRFQRFPRYRVANCSSCVMSSRHSTLYAAALGAEVTTSASVPFAKYRAAPTSAAKPAFIPSRMRR